MAPCQPGTFAGGIWTFLPLSGRATLPVWAHAVEGSELYSD